MLDKRRIKQAQKNLSIYIEDRLIRKTKETREKILETYKRNCRESLEVAEKLLKEDVSCLWVIVASYYSMYYITNAVLYHMGYKVGDKIVHKVTSEALIVLIKDKLKKKMLEDYERAKEEALDITGQSDSIIESFHKEMAKRSIFQYDSTEEIKKSKAKTSFERAKRFVFEMEKLL
ncbi:MAG: hypothetical protein L6408_04525 [Nanoarchaeota archaeon]|nr:hypothetical protein [Nanoarchaeota archaeon]